MKEAIGGGWLFTLVILLIALFTCFISVSTNYSRSYKVKDEIISAIQRNHGVNETSLTEINDYLGQVGYRSTGECLRDGSKWLGFEYVNGGSSRFTNSKRVNFCIKKHTITYKNQNSKGQCVTNRTIGHPESAYYSVLTFFRLDMPVISNFFDLKVQGETSVIYMNDDIDNFYSIEGRKKCTQ